MIRVFREWILLLVEDVFEHVDVSERETTRENEGERTRERPREKKRWSDSLRNTFQCRGKTFQRELDGFYRESLILSLENVSIHRGKF